MSWQSWRSPELAVELGGGYEHEPSVKLSLVLKKPATVEVGTRRPLGHVTLTAGVLAHISLLMFAVGGKYRSWMMPISSVHRPHPLLVTAVMLGVVIDVVLVVVVLIGLTVLEVSSHRGDCR